MAETVIVHGVTVKKRNPVGVWLLTLVTLTIYFDVWYYRINKEARDVLRDDTIRPWLSVLAFVPGFVLLFIPPLISFHRTGARIAKMEEQAGIEKRISPATGFVFLLLTIVTVLLLLGGGCYYYQSHLNALWTAKGIAKVPVAGQSKQMPNDARRDES